MNRKGMSYNWLEFSTYRKGTECMPGTEAKLDMKAVKKGWEAIEREEELKKIWKKIYKEKNKGGKKLLKIIIKNKETGVQQCVDIPKEWENDSVIKRLRVGMVVVYLGREVVRKPVMVEIVKIVKPGVVVPYSIPPHFLNSPFLHINYPRGAGRATFTKQYVKDIIEGNEGVRARKEYREKPYFLVRLDPIKGKPDGKENLEKMKFPCWVVFRGLKDGKDKIGMLVTGCPGLTAGIEYQLIDMTEQVPAQEVCTIFRDNDLKTLLDSFYSIEVIKGESQVWKMGGFNV